MVVMLNSGFHLGLSYQGGFLRGWGQLATAELPRNSCHAPKERWSRLAPEVAEPPFPAQCTVSDFSPEVFEVPGGCIEMRSRSGFQNVILEKVTPGASYALLGGMSRASGSRHSGVEGLG